VRDACLACEAWCEGGRRTWLLRHSGTVGGDRCVPCRIVPRFLLAEFQRSTLAGKSALLKSIWQELLIFSGALYHKLSDGTLHIVNLWVWGVPGGHMRRATLQKNFCQWV
jgi:hypothetical protein